MKTEGGGLRPRPRDTWGNQKLEEAGRTLPWSLRRERGPVTACSRTSHLQERINVCGFRPPVNGPLKLIWGQQSSKCSGASGGHLEEEGGRLSCLGGPSPSPGSCWEGSQLSLSPQGDARHPNTHFSRPRLRRPLCYPSGCPSVAANNSYFLH